MTDTPASVLLPELDRRWSEYRAQVKACRDDFAEQAVHDLRVGARRLLAVLDITAALHPPPRVRKTRRFLKEQLDDLDDLRDVQVMLAEVAKAVHGLPELGLFQLYLQKREERLLRRARKRIENARPAHLTRRIKKIAAALEEQASNEDLPAQLLGTVDDAYSRAGLAYAEMDVHQPDSVHHARIAFRRFRYMAEITAALLPAPPADFSRRMHAYQNLTGDIRDVVILLETLSHATKEELPGLDPEPIRVHYEKCEADLVLAFLESKADVQTFWRPSPDQDFPWENKDDPLHRAARERGASRTPGRRGRRQPAAADQQGSGQDVSHRSGTEAADGDDRSDPQQSVPAGNADRPHPGKNI
jgi:CHAD domain-containing protein